MKGMYSNTFRSPTGENNPLYYDTYTFSFIRFDHCCQYRFSLERFNIFLPTNWCGRFEEENKFSHTEHKVRYVAMSERNVNPCVLMLLNGT